MRGYEKPCIVDIGNIDLKNERRNLERNRP
jgi:hypothetical protein